MPTSHPIIFPFLFGNTQTTFFPSPVISYSPIFSNNYYIFLYRNIFPKKKTGCDLQLSSSGFGLVIGHRGSTTEKAVIAVLVGRWIHHPLNHFALCTFFFLPCCIVHCLPCGFVHLTMHPQAVPVGRGGTESLRQARCPQPVTSCMAPQDQDRAFLQG